MIKLEVCSGGYEDSLIASQAHATRVELNQALYLGGLTPSMGSYLLTKENTNLEIIVMLRPRGSGFVYSEAEIQTMFKDAELFLENDCDGIAFGFLTPNHEVDEQLTKQMVNLIHQYGKTAVFHRAFDVCIDYHQSIKTLIACGVDRILTSGLAPNAILGKDIIHNLIKEYGNQIEILPGCGINDQNVNELINNDITQIHASCKTYKQDHSATYNQVSYAYIDDDAYEVVSSDNVKALLKQINK